MWTTSHCLPPLPQASELRWLTVGSISLNLTNQTLIQRLGCSAEQPETPG